MTLYLKGCGLAIGVLLAFASNGAATVIAPTVFTDDTAGGNCTLREAIQAANTDTAVDQCPAGSGTDVIKLGGGTYNVSLTAGSPEDANASGDLDITQPLTIQGAGATIDAHGIDRAIDVHANATIQDLTVITVLSLTHTRFAVARGVTARARPRHRSQPKGTTIRFHLSEPASVLIAVTERAAGRRRGKHCVAPTRRLAKAKRCIRTITLGTFLRREPAGTARVPFSGRLRHGALKPGRYALVLTPTDAAKLRGRPHSIAFTIVRG